MGEAPNPLHEEGLVLTRVFSFINGFPHRLSAVNEVERSANLAEVDRAFHAPDPARPNKMSDYEMVKAGKARLSGDSRWV